MIPSGLLPEHQETAHQKQSKIDLVEQRGLLDGDILEEEKAREEQKLTMELIEQREAEQLAEKYDERLQMTEPPLGNLLLILL